MFQTTATPDGKSLGTQDRSRIPLVAEPKQSSNTMELINILAQRGRGEATIVTSAPAILYGEQTFAKGSRYMTHANVFAAENAKTGAPALMRRVIPEDATKAILRYSLEHIPTDLPLYERNIDGSIKTTVDPVTGEVKKVSKGTIPGTRCVLHIGITAYTGDARKFRQANIISDYREGDVEVGGKFLGEITRKDGSKEHTTSTLTPLFDLLLDSEGDFGNHCGLRPSVPTTNQEDPLNLENVIANRSFPFRITVVERDMVNKSAFPVPLINEDLTADYYFRKNAVDSITGQPIGFAKTFVNGYTREATEELTPIWPTFGNLHVYEANILAVQAMLSTGYKYTDSTGGEIEIHGEAMYDDVAVDYGRDPDLAFSNPENYGLLNFLTTRQLNGVAYTAVDISESQLFGGTVIDEIATHYATGGSDGLWSLADGSPADVINLKLFDDAVFAFFTNFGAQPDTLKDILRYPFTKVTDTGFSLNTKKVFDRVIKNRPDVTLDIGTHAVADLGVLENDVGTVYRTLGDGSKETVSSKELLGKWDFRPVLSADEDTAVATMLRTHFALVPESVFFGTPIMRVKVFGEHGYSIPDNYEHPLPGSFDRSLAQNYWSGVTEFSPADDFTEMDNRKPRFLKNMGYRYRDTVAADKTWDAGMNFMKAFDAYQLFWPAVQTIYPHKNSVLSSAKFSTIAARCHYFGMLVWRDISGHNRTDAQFKQDLLDRANFYIATLPEEFEVVAIPVLTEADIARGYSGRLEFHIGAPMMRTKLVYSVHGYRTEQLATAMQGRAPV